MKELFRQILKDKGFSKPLILALEGVTGSTGNVLVTKLTVSYTAFAGTNGPIIFTIPSTSTLHVFKVKHTTPFSGGTITEVLLDINYQGCKHIDALDLTISTGTSLGQFGRVQPTPYITNGTGNVQAFITVTGGIYSDLTAGSFDIWYTTYDTN